MRNSLQEKTDVAHNPHSSALRRGSGHEPSFDIQRILFDTSTGFNPLHRESLIECQAVGVKNGLVILNVALPRDMTRFFVAFIESMTGFFRVMDHKARAASALSNCIDPVQVDKRETMMREYAELICKTFDAYVASGHDRSESVKLTNSALKAQEHPWATYHTLFPPFYALKAA